MTISFYVVMAIATALLMRADSEVAEVKLGFITYITFACVWPFILILLLWSWVIKLYKLSILLSKDDN